MEYIKHSHALVLFASSLGKFGLARKGDQRVVSFCGERKKVDSSKRSHGEASLL